MAVVVFVSAIATFHFYEKDVIARALAEVPTLPNFEHTIIDQNNFSNFINFFSFIWMSNSETKNRCNCRKRK